MNKIEIVSCCEHEHIKEKLDEHNITIQKRKDVKFSQIKQLGVSQYNANYYVGIDWLDEEKNIAILVNPKINKNSKSENQTIDLDKMLMYCLQNKTTATEFSNVYHINLDSKFIETDQDVKDFTPFVMLHFLFLLKELVKRSLKKDYIFVEENLSCKFKGKLLVGSHLKKNIFSERNDRNYCRYQEYSTNCLENRLLNSALEIALSWTKKSTAFQKDYENNIYLREYFLSIGKIKNRAELSKIRVNSLFKNYTEAIRLAKIIYNLQGIEHFEKPGIKKIPPYIINMPILFELYVYAKLLNQNKNLNRKIKFEYQNHGKYGFTDLLDITNKIIIDTKYKYLYNTPEKYIISDIRQVAGYARDIKILKKIGYKDLDQNTPMPQCIIIYPDSKKQTDFIYNLEEVEKIEAFHRIYKLGINIPTKMIKSDFNNIDKQNSNELTI